MTQREGNVLPTIGRHVHYVAHGSADGTYPSVCRAAIVTEVPDKIYEGGDWEENTDRASLCVLDPTVTLFFEGRRHADAKEMKGGTWHWPCEQRQAKVEDEQVMIVAQGKDLTLGTDEGMGPVEPYREGQDERTRTLAREAFERGQQANRERREAHDDDADNPVLHFAPYGSVNTLCGAVVPRGVDWDVKVGDYVRKASTLGYGFTVSRDDVTCAHCLMGIKNSEGITDRINKALLKATDSVVYDGDEPVVLSQDQRTLEDALKDLPLGQLAHGRFWMLNRSTGEITFRHGGRMLSVTLDMKGWDATIEVQDLGPAKEGS